MMKNKTPIIPTNEFNVITEAVTQAKAYADEKFKSISWLMVGIVIVCFIAFVQLVVDSFHINNAIYREYSEKISILETTQASYKELFEQNKQNQKIILEQQEQILRLLKK